MPRHPLLYGVLCALGAGLVWGLVFVAPLILADYPPALLAFGRYLAFGLICLPLAWRDRRRLAQLSHRDWLAALELALVGNILYYLCLAAAIQLAGGALPTLIIGTLPVVISIVSNFHGKPLPWGKLLPPLGVIGLGIVLVNQHEQALAPTAGSGYAAGLLLAVLALACWTWYPIRNARWLKLHPALSSSTWATAQGLASLPLSLIGMAASWGWLATQDTGFAFPLGPRPLLYVGLMLAIGLFASWLGTLLWNRASQLLPTALSGQLIVFETLAALAYAFIWQRNLPSLTVTAGILLLITGVVLGVRAFNQQQNLPETILPPNPPAMTEDRPARTKKKGPSKEETALLPAFPALTLAQIHVPASPDEFAAAAAEILSAGAVGFDTEARPTFHVGQASDGPHIVQFALEDKAFIFQTHHEAARAALVTLLQAESLIKAGFGLKSDCSQIRAKLGAQLGGVLDLDQLFRKDGYSGDMGVRAAVGLVLGQRFHKSKKVTTSNWSLRELSAQQLLYAANDAYAAFKVFAALREKRPELF